MISIDETWLKDRANDLKASVLFLTRLRYGPAEAVAGAELARAGWAFPIAGILVGLVGAVVYALAHRLGLTPFVAAALSIAATMALTGCLHEDGLADTADGFGGGDTREQKLTIMRDSRIGTYGVCALALSILLRAGALASILGTGHAVAALIAAHAAARAMLPVFMFFVSPARADGLSFAAGHPPIESVTIAAVIGIIILALCLGPLHAIAALILLALAAIVLGWLSVSQIGGQTGDVLGALEQVSEIVILLAAVHWVPIVAGAVV